MPFVDGCSPPMCVLISPATITRGAVHVPVVDVARCQKYAFSLQRTEESLELFPSCFPP